MRTIIVNSDGPRGPQGPTGPQSTGTINQLLFTTTSSFSTNDLLNNESQNGKHVVINNGCVADGEDDYVTIHENAVSKQVRFSFNAFEVIF